MLKASSRPSRARPVAPKKLARGGYDLILTDTKMPALDGVDFYRELKSRFAEICRRVIFLTGDVLDRAKRICKEEARWLSYRARLVGRRSLPKLTLAYTAVSL